jgi:hypothetical protein
MSRLENAPSKTEAARLCLISSAQSVKPGKLEVLDIDDTFCAAHGGQQLAFWNAHHDERGFASMHLYHAGSGSIMRAAARWSPPSFARRAPRRAQRCEVVPPDSARTARLRTIEL